MGVCLLFVSPSLYNWFSFSLFFYPCPLCLPPPVPLNGTTHCMHSNRLQDLESCTVTILVFLFAFVGRLVEYGPPCICECVICVYVCGCYYKSNSYLNLTSLRVQVYLNSYAWTTCLYVCGSRVCVSMWEWVCVCGCWVCKLVSCLINCVLFKMWAASLSTNMQLNECVCVCVFICHRKRR